MKITRRLKLATAFLKSKRCHIFQTKLLFHDSRRISSLTTKLLIINLFSSSCFPFIYFNIFLILDEALHLCKSRKKFHLFHRNYKSSKKVRVEGVEERIMTRFVKKKRERRKEQSKSSYYL